ncbi:cytoskeleton-associated protein 2 isoform X3 [Apodemus sylvaticus]|uniref:cytoskeleton-associated protein 2 isoform X3 n=1 Tax=Apodemus sylvaticus TaxID=10129 RepID=UPI002242CF5F|nr:cytoskeleton-associated protein 2 isoform X3 [Apodemus sylvaticus]
MAESRKRCLGRAVRKSLPVPRDLQLPPTKRDQPAFREQRKQKLKEYLLIRKTMFPYQQENQISRDEKMITSEDQVQEGKKVVKLKTEVADKENIGSIVEENCIPLKAGEVTTSEIHNLKDNIQAVQLLSTRDASSGQTVTLDQARHHKDNKKMQMTAEKPKQDTDMSKKRVLGYYHGQVVQSKINSFRKLPNVKGETLTATKKLPTTVSKATKAQCEPANAVSVRASNTAAATKSANTKSASTSSKSALVRPPIRSLHSGTHGTAKQGLSRPLASVSRGSLRSEPVVSVVKTGSSQDTKRDNKAPSRSITSKDVTRTNSSNTRQIVKSKDTDQRRYTIAGVALPKDATAQRKAQMTEWKTGKGKVLKRPPHSVVTQAEPKGQNENPVGSFWTTMAEEDEQRLFTEKVNQTISECLNLINKPIEEMRHIIIDILTTKNQEKVNSGENIEEAHTTKEHIQEVNVEANPGSGKPKGESEHHEKVEVCEDNQDNKTEDPTNGLTTPDSKTEAGCIIRYNVSSTPLLQSMKKMQHGKNSTFKELKFLTPVRRSRRIQDKTLQLPAMLKDHDPSVSSLEQLSELGGDAFVCRPNAALCPLVFESEAAEEE